MNTWYVAASADEIKNELFSRTICGRSVLLFRKENGDCVASSNRCPHRFAPLDKGRLVGDGVVECPYHGLQFDVQSGNCVHNPHGDGKISKAACVATYPIEERHGLVWVWLGEPEAADTDKIPDFHFLTDTKFRTLSGLIGVRANYELIVDNLMDLSHVEYLHAGGLGSEAIKRGETEVIQNTNTVHSNRWCPDGMAPPVWDALFDNYGKPVDHWLDMRWDPPALLCLDVGVTPVGAPRADGVSGYFCHFLTPETETTTHYFWTASRTFKIHDTALDSNLSTAIHQAFVEEDVPMIEGVQTMMGGIPFDKMNPVLLQPDAGALRSRRVLKQLIEAECAGER
ncbi:aromatic ring-hydroxylating dioxygenase subunit alpha [Trinickia dinghuensis]|nr:aromatic ring-hydroxylating dioxygenase subunit alpha [Trinickia dinghuensis]